MYIALNIPLFSIKMVKPYFLGNNSLLFAEDRDVEHLINGKDYLENDYDRAIAEFTEAIKINLEFAKAYFYRAVAYSKKGKCQLAIKNYTKAIEINPEFYKAYNNRGLVFMDKGDPDRAIEDFSKAIEIDPENALAYYNRGNAYFK